MLIKHIDASSLRECIMCSKNVHTSHPILILHLTQCEISVKGLTSRQIHLHLVSVEVILSNYYPNIETSK